MMMNINPKPWYRQPLVLMLIFLPASAVVGSFLSLYFAVTTDDGEVEDNYYEQGLHINRVLDQDRAAARYGLQGQLTLDPAQRMVRVSLSAKAHGLNMPRLDLKLLHATRQGMDRTVTLTQVTPGIYQGALPALAPGHWYMHLFAEDWRLTGDLHVPGSAVATLAPSE